MNYYTTSTDSTKENDRELLFNRNLRDNEKCNNHADSLWTVKRLESSQPRSEQVATASLTGQEPKVTKSNFTLKKRKKETRKKHSSNIGCPLYSKSVLVFTHKLRQVSTLNPPLFTRGRMCEFLLARSPGMLRHQVPPKGNKLLLFSFPYDIFLPIRRQELLTELSSSEISNSNFLGILCKVSGHIISVAHFYFWNCSGQRCVRDRNMTSRNEHKMFVRKLGERDHLGNLGQFQNNITTDLSDLAVSRDSQDVQHWHFKNICLGLQSRTLRSIVDILGHNIT